MDTANMISERRMKQGFILATLISTIAGTFTTGINLFDRVSEKRRDRAQRKLDKTQDKKIKELEKRVKEAEEGKNANNNPPQQERQQEPDRNRENDLRGSLEQGGPMVKREFDRHYANMGPRFAEGDLIAQTQLQSQVITLQSTVIKMLEEALFTGKLPDMQKLYNASEFARMGSIRALEDQTMRLQQSLPIRRPIGPVRRTSSTPTLRSSSTSTSTTTDTSSTTSSTTTDSSDSRSRWAQPHTPTRYNQPPQKALTLFDKGGPLFCRYAEDLQRTRHALDERFFGGSCMCPDCNVAIDLSPAGGYKIDKEVVITERIIRPGSGATELVKRFEDRTYLLTSRFLVKCHRERVGFACYLCFRHRDKDTLCKTMQGLVGHVADKHDIREYETDPDIRDVTR
ncbi:hypothetical protein B0H66DRAFT_547409 [Apodospora peruviana]|uniref:Uncharacterized protein n=1 Tax=Apodospora peruviana TaxID=516989 RepID=A0AAE0MAL8_9PEZI|nr:hypothetical protein B0H66DRAFT_547409 [Apodospora peruviana]